MNIKNIITRGVKAVFLLIVISGLSAGIYSKPVSENLLREATGITSDDIKAARNKQSLSLFDLYALGVADTERLAVERENTVQAEARKDQAFGAFLPRLSLRASKSLTDTPISSQTGVSLYARQNIITGLNEWTGFRGASHEIKAFQQRFHREASLYMLEVASAYYRVQAAASSIVNKKRIIDNYNGIRAEQARRVNLGRSRRSDLLRTISQIHKLEAELASAEKELAAARNRLALLTGVNENSVIESPPEFEEPVLPDAASAARIADESPAVASAVHELSLAKNAVLYARGGHLPSIYLDGGYYLYRENSRGSDYYAGIGAELPIFSGGITSAKVAEAQSAEKQAELKLNSARREAVKEIEDAAAGYKGLADEYEASKRALASAEAGHRSVLADYRMNLVTILDVFSSLTSLESAKNEFDRIGFERGYARVRLMAAMNLVPGPGISKLKGPVSPEEGR